SRRRRSAPSRIPRPQSATATTFRPRYVPHEGQTWWLRAGSLQEGQRLTLGGVTFQCVRRCSFFCLDVRFFGAATIHSSTASSHRAHVARPTRKAPHTSRVAPCPPVTWAI